MTLFYSAPQTKKHFRSKIRLKVKNRSLCRITVRMKKPRSHGEAKRTAIRVRNKIHLLMSIRWKTLWRFWLSRPLPNCPYKHKTLSPLREIFIRSCKVWPWKQRKSQRASTLHFTFWIALYSHSCKSKTGTAPTRILSLAERPPLSLIMILETVGKWY